MNTGTFYSRVGNGIADYLWQELHIRPNIHYRIKHSEEGPRVLSLFVVISPSYLKKIGSITEQQRHVRGLIAPRLALEHMEIRDEQPV